MSPVLEASDKTWAILLNLSERMKQCPILFDHAAFQVNLDIAFSEEEILGLLVFFKKYEHILFKFSTGGKEYLRSLKYSKSLQNFFRYQRPFSREHYALEELMCGKYYAISLKNNIKDNKNLPATIMEFRSPNGCNDAWLWQNYINTFIHFKNSIKNINPSMLDYNCTMRSKPYAVLNLEDAISFANIIFDNYLDKLYFLRQYIGHDLVNLKNDYKKLTIGGGKTWNYGKGQSNI